MVNLPWDPRLGAVRVYMELAEQWQKSGHVVTNYSLSDAFPEANVSSAKFTLRQLLSRRERTIRQLLALSRLRFSR